MILEILKKGLRLRVYNLLIGVSLTSQMYIKTFQHSIRTKLRIDFPGRRRTEKLQHVKLLGQETDGTLLYKRDNKQCRLSRTIHGLCADGTSTAELCLQPPIASSCFSHEKLLGHVPRVSLGTTGRSGRRSV